MMAIFPHLMRSGSAAIVGAMLTLATVCTGPLRAEGVNAESNLPLDFDQVRLVQKATLQQALSSPPSVARDAKILDNVETIMFLADSEELAALNSAFDQQTSSRDTTTVFRMWKSLQLIMNSVANKAQGISVPTTETLSGKVDPGIEAEFAEDRGNLNGLKKNLDRIAPSVHRSVLRASIALELATIARIGNDNNAAIAAADQALPNIEWARQTAPLIAALTQLRSAAARDKDSSDDTARTELKRLVSAAEKARAFWSRRRGCNYSVRGGYTQRWASNLRHSDDEGPGRPGN